jgi:hypothetical protein
MDRFKRKILKITSIFDKAVFVCSPFSGGMRVKLKGYRKPKAEKSPQLQSS